MIGTLFSFCQNNESAFIKTGELIGYAKSAERYGDVYSAIDYYAEYNGRNKRNLKITSKLADLYFEIKDYKHATPLYIELYQSGKEEYSSALFNYAKILKVENKTDSAIACFEIYHNQILKLKDNPTRDLILYNINHEIEGCHNAEMLKNPDSDIKVIPLNNSVNNAYKDYAPLLWNDSVLIFPLLSNRPPLILYNLRLYPH